MPSSAFSVTAFVVVFRRKRYLPVGWFWFLGTLVPVIGLVQVGEASMADRYAYIPLIGIFVMIAWSLDDWAEARKIRTVFRVLPAVCVLAMLSCVTFRQMSYWESDYDLWSHTLEIGEGSFAHNAVAADLMNPDQSMTQHDLRNFDTEQERMDEARRHFERSLELHQQAAEKDPGEHLPEIAMTLISLGTLERLQNRSDEGRQHYEEALKIRRQLARQNPAVYLPEMATTLSNLGTLDLMQNRIDEARGHYQEALMVLWKLSQGDSKYADDVARVEASLQELDKKVKPR